MTVDGALSGVHFGWREFHFVGVVIARHRNARQDFAHLGFVVHKLQQRLAAGAPTADAKNVLGGRVQVKDKQTVVKQDDAGRQAVEDVAGVGVERSAARVVVAYLTVVC